MRVPGQFTGEIRDSLRDLMWKEAGIVVSAVCDTPTRLPTMVSPLDRKSYAFVYVRTLPSLGLVHVSGSERTCSSVRSAFCLPALRIG